MSCLCCIYVAFYCSPKEFFLGTCIVNVISRVLFPVHCLYFMVEVLIVNLMLIFKYVLIISDYFYFFLENFCRDIYIYMLAEIFVSTVLFPVHCLFVFIGISCC